MQRELMAYGIYQKLVSCNQLFPRDVALLYYRRSISFRGMFVQVERCACSLLRWGVKQGDRVLLCSAAVPEMVYTLLALWRLGAVPILINPKYSKEQIAQIIRQSGASLFFVLDQLFPSFDNVTRQNEMIRTIVIPVTQSMPLLVRRSEGAKFPLSSVDMDAPRLILWKEFLESGRAICTAPVVPLSEEQTAAVIYSEKATKEEDGIIINQASILARINRYRQREVAWERQNRLFNMAPSWSSMGVFDYLIVPLCLGLTIILEPNLQSDAFRATLMRERPQYLVGEKHFLLSEIKKAQLEGADLNFLHNVYTLVS